MKPKILIVDDEWKITEVLKSRFRHAGFHVITALSASEFRNKAVRENPDVIILDILLGDQNGVETYDDLLQRGFNPRIPVIFLSALVENHPEKHALPGRRCALYGKPFDPHQLVNDIRFMMRN